MGQYLLENGLNAASLRPLAKAAGTSDRMLIYHFGSKDALLDEVLLWLADRVLAQLDASVPPTRFETVAQCADFIKQVIRAPTLREPIALWLELSAGAARGNERYAALGKQISEAQCDWLLRVLPQDTPRGLAVSLYAVVEGALVMHNVGMEALADEAITAAFAPA